MKKICYTLIASMLFLTGCYDDELTSFSDVKTFSSFTASVADIGITRSHLENGKQVVWDNGDKIGVYSDTQNVKSFTYRESVFSGGEISGNTFYAFYPYKSDAVDATDRNVVHMSLYGAAGYTSDGYNRALPMVAKSTGNTLRFKQTCGLLRFSLKGSNIISHVRLETNNNEMITGDGIIDLSADEPVLQMVADAAGSWRSSVDMWPNKLQLKSDEASDFYFIVPVGVYEKGITLYIYGTDATTGQSFVVMKRTDKQVEIKRAMIKTFTGLDTDSLLEEEMDAFMKEREALMSLYNSTNGASWTNNENWGSDKDLGEWYGVSTNQAGHVVSLYLFSNGMNGKLPPNIGDLSSLIYLGIGDNMLSGAIPESIGNLSHLEYAYLHGNALSGDIPESIGNLPSLNHLWLQDNQLTGTIPDSFMNLDHLETFYISGNNMDGVLSEALLKSDWWENMHVMVSQRTGHKLQYGWLYESTDFSKDGTVELLQHHQKGNGIKMVITGEAFSDRLISDGTFATVVDEAVDAFFDIEPYASFKDYFDIYVVTAVSRNEVIGQDVAFTTAYENTFYNIDDEKVSTYVLKVSDLNYDLADVTTLVILNEKASGARVHCSMYSDGFAVGLSTLTNERAYEINHELGGHGFGKLADEYANDDASGSSVFTDKEGLKAQHNAGWFLNVDSESDATQVLWKDFISNTDYQIEKIGVFEGAMGSYSKGVYRPTETSIMRSEYGWFNAPSRWAIYQRIGNLAGASYTFDDFLAYDKQNLQQMSGTRSYVERAEAEQVSTLGAPPIVHNYPSSEIGKH